MQPPHALERIRAEFLEMPGLCLTHEQVRRFCGIDPTLITLVLDELVDTRFLHRDARGFYLRVTAETRTHSDA